MGTLSTRGRSRVHEPPRCMICKDLYPKSERRSYCEPCLVVLRRIAAGNDNKRPPYIKERVEALARHTARIQAEMAKRKAVA